MSDSDNQIDKFGTELSVKISQTSYRPILPIIKNIIVNSIEENFNQGGRFGSGPFGGGETRWRKSKRAIKQAGQTLQDTGRLAASIRVNVKADQGKINIEIGSNLTYAAIHQFGGDINHPGGTPYISLGNGLVRFVKKETASKLGIEKKTKPHIIRMPARPFLVLQDEDIDRINQTMVEYLAKVFG